MSDINSIRVTKEIERAILSGQLKPRERLVEMDLISKFGISRTVVRESLKRLEAKGIIRTTPYRGAMVADLTVEEIEEIYYVRSELEKIAARLILEHITTQEIRHLKKLSKEVEKNLREKTLQMIEKDSEFHRVIFKACRNNYLYRLIDFLRIKAHIVRFNAWSLPHRIEESIFEHRMMVKAIEKKDIKELEKLFLQHLNFSKNSYLTQLKGGDFKNRLKGDWNRIKSQSK